MTIEFTDDGLAITWETKNMTEVFQDCFDLNVTHQNWYGGPQRYTQLWPIEKMIINGSEPYIIKKTDNFAVAERYWVNSKGAYLFVNETSPLFVDQNLANKEQICFKAKADGPYIGRKRVRIFLCKY